MSALLPAFTDAPWLREGATAQILALLNDGAEEARVVGGAVRNALLDLRQGDIDIATTALPEEVVRRAAEAGIKCVPTGIEHGTVMLVRDGHSFEVTTLREDVETFGRKAKVAFGRDWKRDAERRDFTINALSVDAAGTVHDYVGGLADLKVRRVRFIGDADKRIAEDYLRILRFFRIHAEYGEGAPDPGGLLACIRGRAGLAMLSAERVRAELLKLVMARHAVAALAHMSEIGILVSLLGGVQRMASFSNMIKAETSVGIAPDAVRRLGALGVYVAEDAERLAGRLRLANVEAAQLASMADRWWVTPADDNAARASLYRLGVDRYRDRILLGWARDGHGADRTRWRELATLPGRWTAPAFPLKSADFVARGIEKGPALGAAMRAAEEAWIAQGFPLLPEALSAIVEAARHATSNAR
jgi:poly(A) polymerase